MMHYGLIELHLKTLWECLLTKWSMGKLVIPVELEHKARWAIKQLNFDFKTAGEKESLI